MVYFCDGLVGFVRGHADVENCFFKFFNRAGCLLVFVRARKLVVLPVGVVVIVVIVGVVVGVVVIGIVVVVSAPLLLRRGGFGVVAV